MSLTSPFRAEVRTDSGQRRHRAPCRREVPTWCLVRTVFCHLSACFKRPVLCVNAVLRLRAYSGDETDGPRLWAAEGGQRSRVTAVGTPDL